MRWQQQTQQAWEQSWQRNKQQLQQASKPADVYVELQQQLADVALERQCSCCYAAIHQQLLPCIAVKRCCCTQHKQGGCE